jgi:glucose-1-phosphate adenylyltransferase
MCDCGYVGNLDFGAFMDFHEKTDAVMTGFYTDHPLNNVKGVTGTVANIDKDGRITDLKVTEEKPDDMKLLTNTWIIGKEYLMEMLSRAVKEHKVSLRREVIAPMLKTEKIMAYKSEDPILFLDDLSGYLKCNLDLLNKNVRNDIFDSDNGPVLTKTKDSPPTRYGSEAKVSNSLIADGCIIEGEVKDSVIFRGVRVKKGAKIESSVVMQDSTIGEYAQLNCAVLDKNVIIMDGRTLSGYITYPFFCARHSVI